MPGYAGGTVPNPTYEAVCAGETGHAEVIRIEYDPGEIAYEDLLTVFFATHNPAELNRQGADMGTQYRSVIFPTTEAQGEAAESFIKNLEASGLKVVTEVAPLEAFYEAEDYHRQYYLNNSSAPYCRIVIEPKLEKLRSRYGELLKKKPADSF